MSSSDDAGTAGRGLAQHTNSSAAMAPTTTATTTAASSEAPRPAGSTAGRGAVPSSCAEARLHGRRSSACAAADGAGRGVGPEQAECGLLQGVPGVGEGLQLCCVAVPFNSQCEHHMLPFYGCASVVFARQASNNGSSCTEGGAHGDEGARGRCSSSKSSEEGGSSKRGRGVVRTGRTRGSAGSVGVAGIAVENGDGKKSGPQEPQTRGECEKSNASGLSAGRDAGVQRAVRCASTDERQVVEAVVSMYTQRLQVQERITHQVADAVAAELDAAAVVVVVDAAHMCMVARGVENHAGRTTTMASRGLARTDAALCRQALLLGSSQQRERSKPNK